MLTVLQDDHQDPQEPPETPAPLFAIRAFKSAIFGTPVPDNREGDKINKPQDPVQVRADDVSARGMGPSKEAGTEQELSKKISTKSNPDPFASPSKGILLTPGIGSTRRKTVSFGALGPYEKKDSGEALQNSRDLEVIPKKSLQNTRAFPAKADELRQSTLKRTLFQAIEPTQVLPTQLNKQHSDTTSSIQKHQSSTGAIVVRDTDVTIDLKDPRSRSGRHWKVEYERYHEKSDREMRRLIKYSQIAKSYAVKKDTEAMDLSEKLKKELSKMTEMETRVSELASQLVNRPSQDDNEANSQVELLQELATQTALALRYKQKAEKYRKAIHAQNSLSHLDDGQNDFTCESHTSIDPCNVAKDHHKPEDLLSLRTEVARLQGSAKGVEERAARLEHENTALKETMSRVKEEMKNYEARHQAREERHRQKEEKVENQKRSIQEQLAKCKLECQQRVDAIKESNDARMAKLLQELEELKGLQNGRTKDRVVEPHDYVYWQQQQRKLSGELRQSREDTRNLQIENEDLRQRNQVTDERDVVAIKHFNAQKRSTRKPSIDIWSVVDAESPIRKAAGAGTSTLAVDDINYTPLKEINHNVATEHSNKVGNDKAQDTKATTVHSVSLKHDALDSSALPALPSPEASMFLMGKGPYGRPSMLDSPRSSVLASSPPKPVPLGPPLSIVPVSPKANAKSGPRVLPNTSTIVSSNRASSLAGGRTRSLLPPDRAAAARMRLQQRNAEKRGHQDMNKKSTGQW